MKRPDVSVVIATHNRHESLARLLGHLADQTLAADRFEVVVVDDGSVEEAAPKLVGRPQPRRLRVVRQAQGGPGAARHHGVTLAAADIVVFLDDDMQLPRDFLSTHLAYHWVSGGPTVVLGNILPSGDLASLPLFERYHARQLDRFRAAAAEGTIPMRGVHLCTGNVSMPRAAYLAVGGFDASLKRSEDRELGVRLEKAGCRFVFGGRAASRHESDHNDLGVWLRRAYLYGRFDTKIGRMHRDVDNTHPWRFWSLVHPLSRPLLAGAIVAPWLGRLASRGAYAAGVLLDRMGLEGAAVTLTALTYGMEYFRGVREECGSLAGLRAELRAYRSGPAQDAPARDSLAAAGSPEPRRPASRPGMLAAGRRALAAIRADYDATRRQRLKYHGEEIPARRIWLDLFRKVGFQMLVWYRVMRFFREGRVPLVPQVMSRLIRHLYGAEIHWDARLEPGVSIVHGVGLVLSHAAVVGQGCILFQNVTLGENLDGATGRIGAPRLERDVHVGPGATLLGPITVGEGSKVMAGTVLLGSVPPRSLVQAPEVQVAQRAQPGERRHGAAVARAVAGAA